MLQLRLPGEPPSSLADTSPSPAPRRPPHPLLPHMRFPPLRPPRHAHRCIDRRMLPGVPVIRSARGQLLRSLDTLLSTSRPKDQAAKACQAPWPISIRRISSGKLKVIEWGSFPSEQWQSIGIVQFKGIHTESARGRTDLVSPGCLHQVHREPRHGSFLPAAPEVRGRSLEATALHGSFVSGEPSPLPFDMLVLSLFRSHCLKAELSLSLLPSSPSPFPPASFPGRRPSPRRASSLPPLAPVP